MKPPLSFGSFLTRSAKASPLAAVAREFAPPTHTREGANALPIVTAHGMGDSCFNEGMKSVTAAAGKRVGAYAVCVPPADNRVADTVDGFLKNMDRSVAAFAERVRKDPKLKGGFNALGLSQGNNVIRGALCGNQISGAPRDVVFVAASARWLGDSTPSTRRCRRGRVGSMAWKI